jgi:hypothetical protein
VIEALKVSASLLGALVMYWMDIPASIIALLALMACGLVMGAAVGIAEGRPNQLRTFGFEFSRRMSAFVMLLALDILADFSLHVDVDVVALFVPVLLLHEGLGIMVSYSKFGGPGAEFIDKVAEWARASLAAKLRAVDRVARVLVLSWVLVLARRRCSGAS